MRFNLISGFNLGLSCPGLPIDGSDRLDALEKAVELSSDCAALLIAGDFISSSDESLLSRINEILLKKGNSKILISLSEKENAMLPGLSGRLTGADFIFTGQKEPFQISDGNEKIFIYGNSSTNEIFTQKKQDHDGFHMGLFRYDIESQAVNETELKSLFRALPLDFYAFGGQKQPKIYKVSGKVISAYPGECIQSSPSLPSDKFMLKLTVSQNYLYEIKRVIFPSAKAFSADIDFSTTGKEEAFAIIKENSNTDIKASITFRGMRNFQINDISGECSKMYKTAEISDESFPSLSLLADEYKESGVRREFLDILASNPLPGGINECDVAKMVDGILKNGAVVSEDWFCALLNA